MDDYVYLAILGVVQGVAEFLPISSSGHLVILGSILQKYSQLSIPAENATINVALHFGSLLSITVVYWRDLLALFRNPKLIGMIVLASVPVGIVGVMWKDQLEALFDKPLYAGLCLMITAGMLLFARRCNRTDSGDSEVTLRTALIVGAFQAVAILPGISRAGSTIAGGLIGGLKRVDAARFSFLIALPAIGGATLLEVLDFFKGETPPLRNAEPLVLGAVISFVVGVFCLRWLIRLVVADRLHWFAMYCLTAGVATVVWQLVSGG